MFEQLKKISKVLPCVVLLNVEQSLEGAQAHNILDVTTGGVHGLKRHSGSFN